MVDYPFVCIYFRDQQEGGGNAFAGYVGNDELNGVRVDRNIVVVIAAHAPRRLHHAGYFESGNGRFAHGKKQALDVCRQLHVFQKFITLLDIPLYDVNNKGEAQQCREIVEEAQSRSDVPRGIKIVEQDTNHNETVTNVLTQEDRADTERKNVEINE